MKNLSIAFLPHLGRSITRYTRASRARIVYELIRGMARRGHKTYLIGTTDSHTEAVNIPVLLTGVNRMGLAENEFYRHNSYILQVLKKLELEQQRFDIVHNHLYPEFLPYLLGPQLKIPMLTTIHTEMQDYTLSAFKLFPHAHLAALSQAHKAMAKGVHIEYVVNNGVNMNVFGYHEKPGDYFLFVGRIKIIKKSDGTIYDPKGLLTAIAVAKKLKIKLLISGSFESPKMFEEFVRPHLSDKIQLVGGVSKEAPLSQEEIAALYQRARAVLFPIHWEEPFGLVVIEANACGTPVIAFKRGAVAELVQNGVNGFVVNTEAEFMEAVKKVDTIDRKKCREAVETRFNRETMVGNYEKIYFELIGNKR